MRYPDSDGKYNNWFFLTFPPWLWDILGSGLTCFARRLVLGGVEDTMKWRQDAGRPVPLLWLRSSSSPEYKSSFSSSSTFHNLSKFRLFHNNPVSLGDLEFGLAGGRCCCCLYRGRRGRLPENGLSPSHPVTLARRSPVFLLFELVSSHFPGVTSLCEQIIISRFLWGFCSRESVGWNPFACCQSSARRRGEKMVKWGFLGFFIVSPALQCWYGVSDRMSVTSPECGALPPKAPKSGRRKISLPWFRQASIGERLTRLTSMRRQHTVDTSALDSGSNSPSCLPPDNNKASLRCNKNLTGSASMEVRLPKEKRNREENDVWAWSYLREGFPYLCHFFPSTIGANICPAVQTTTNKKFSTFLLLKNTLSLRKVRTHHFLL